MDYKKRNSVVLKPWVTLGSMKNAITLTTLLYSYEKSQ